MPEPMPFERCLEVIERSAAALAGRAGAADPGTPVATCPGWRLADLVAHQGMVHRWATAQLRLDETPVPSAEEFLQAVPAERLVDWFTDGARDLLAALRSVDPDVPAMVFLKDAPRPREFWARRQAHETTVHAVDALSAVRGGMPTTADAAVETDVALDGIDELVTGFFARGRSKLTPDDPSEPLTIAIDPTDADRGWSLRIADGRLRAERARRGDEETVLTGTAAELYLGLWNRCSEISETGRPVLARWRERQRVRWG